MPPGRRSVDIEASADGGSQIPAHRRSLTFGEWTPMRENGRDDSSETLQWRLPESKPPPPSYLAIAARAFASSTLV
jgi:hypothetical protein